MTCRILFSIVFSAFTLSVSAQEVSVAKLYLYYQKFIDFSDQSQSYYSDDSAMHYRALFKEQIINGIKVNDAATLYALSELARQEIGFQFQKTTDTKLYSVCWDDQTGGTMRNFEGFYIYQNGSAYVTETIHPVKDEFSAASNVYALHQVNTSKGKAIYLQFEYVKASTALFSYTVSSLSIEHGKLNRQAKYIKTGSGLQHSISYGLDWSEKVNRDRGNLNIKQAITYDANLKQFSFPLVQQDGTISTKRIKYGFKGNYFELLR